jgi:hypothetical protein
MSRVETDRDEQTVREILLRLYAAFPYEKNVALIVKNSLDR